MPTPSWPDTISYTDISPSDFDEVATAIQNDPDGQHDADQPFPLYAAGDARVIYDISDYTSMPAVLRVAHNQVGIRETRAEVIDRDRWPTPLRDRLVPVLDHDPEYRWSVQPLCSSLPRDDMPGAVEELSRLVEEAGGDPREVYAANIGAWNSHAVIYDYGGL